MATVLKVRRLVRNPSLSIDAYLLEEQSGQILPRSDLKRRSLRLFEQVTKQEQQQDE